MCDEFVVYGDDVVCVVGYFGFVGYQDYCDVVMLVEIDDQFYDVLVGFGIEVIGWFVGEEYFGVVGESLCDGNVLLLIV